MIVAWICDGVGVGRELADGQTEIRGASESGEGEVSGPDQKPVPKIGEIKCA